MNLKKRAGVLAALFFAVFATAKGSDLIPDLDVPYEPTHPRVVEKMLSVAGVSEGDIVYDLGCGDGRIVVAAVKDFGAAGGVGIDLDPRRIREANERALGFGVQDRVEFIEGDIMDADISDATVIAIYLLNSVNLMLRPKLFMELKPGTRIVSHAFHMSEWKEERRIYHERARNRSIYYWVIPAHLGGVWIWETETGDGTSINSMDIEQRFQQVSGTLYSGESVRFEITDASLKGLKFSFSAEIGIGEKPVKVRYEGTVNGNSITGTQTRSYKNKEKIYPWKASRKAEELYGRWNISIDGDKSLHGGVLNLSRKGNMINASYRMKDSPDLREIKHIYVWGNSVYFYLPLPEGGGDLIFSGNLSGNIGGGTITDETDGPVKYFWTGARIK